MLQTIRDYFSGIFSWVIIAMIGVPFALWGINSYTDKEGKASDVALVNGQGIDQPEFLRASQQQQERLKEMLGQAYNPEMFNTPQYKRQVLDQLIDRNLLDQAAVSNGLDIGNDQLSAHLMSQPDLQRNGKYAPDLYQAFLRNQGLTAAGFEARLRNSLRAKQLQDVVANSGVLANAELEDMVRLRDQYRDITYLVLPQSAYAANLKVDDAKVSAYYESHRQDFMNPERVQLDYLDYSIDGLMATVPVNEQVLHRAYDDQSANLINDEQRRASHILIKVPANADAKTKEAALATLSKVQKGLKAGDSFEALAKQYSQDKASALKGGDLGFFGKGVMDKAFEDAVFKLEKNKVSAPVLSSFGWHLIKLTEVKAAKQKSFEEARADLERGYRHSQAEKLYYDHTDGLADIVYEQPDSLEPAAKLLQVSIQKSDWLTRIGGAGIGAYPKVIEAAFSAELLTQGNNSEVIEVAPNHVVVARIKTHEQASQKQLPEVRDKIVETLRTEMARTKAAEAGKALVQRLTKGAKLGDIAAELKLAVKDVPGLKRKDAGQPPEVVAATFRLAKPVKGQTNAETVALENGDQVVLVLQAVHDGDPTKLSKEDLLAYKRELLRAYGTSEFEAMVDALRAQAKIKVWDDRIN